MRSYSQKAPVGCVLRTMGGRNARPESTEPDQLVELKSKAHHSSDEGGMRFAFPPYGYHQLVN